MHSFQLENSATILIITPPRSTCLHWNSAIKRSPLNNHFIHSFKFENSATIDLITHHQNPQACIEIQSFKNLHDTTTIIHSFICIFPLKKKNSATITFMDTPNLTSFLLNFGHHKYSLTPTNLIFMAAAMFSPIVFSQSSPTLKSLTNWWWCVSKEHDW